MTSENRKTLKFEDESEIGRLTYFFDTEMEKLGKYPIWKKITVRGAKFSSKTIQRGYKEIKDLSFRGDLIDFICFISLSHLLSIISVNEWLWKVSIKDNLDKLDDFLNNRKERLRLICRLILKDENYLDYTFKFWKVNNKEMYDGMKKVIFDNINKLLKVEPGEINKYNKLNPN
jgi:hypothetical protein